MLIELIIALLIGVLFGTMTGLTPGIHINLIGGILISLSFTNINSVYLITFVVSMAITHTFLDFIPSVFLGVPDTDTELSVLPGHQFLKNKKGYEAIYLSNKGSFIAIFLILILLVPSILIMKDFYNLIRKIIPYLLIIISFIIIMTEKRKINALIVFLLTGFLGYSLLGFNITEPLLPLLTGLFGASNIIISIKNKTEIPKQKITKPRVSLKKPIIGAILASPFCSFLPGVGSGQAAVIGNSLVKQDQKEFLVLLGITNTLVMGFSFISLYILNKARTGTASVIQALSGKLEINYLVLIIFVVIISGTLAFFLTNLLAKFFSIKLGKVNYKIISYATLILLSVVVLLISGIMGFIILIISTLTGIYCINLGVKRTNMMGSLIIPTILFFL